MRQHENCATAIAAVITDKMCTVLLPLLTVFHVACCSHVLLLYTTQVLHKGDDKLGLGKEIARK
jgi:hypothetical protein